MNELGTLILSHSNTSKYTLSPHEFESKGSKNDNIEGTLDGKYLGQEYGKYNFRRRIFLVVFWSNCDVDIDTKVVSEFLD